MSELTKEMLEEYLSSKGFNPKLVRISMVTDQVYIYPVTYLGERYNILKDAIIGFWVKNPRDPSDSHFCCYRETLLQRIKGEV